MKKVHFIFFFTKRILLGVLLAVFLLPAPGLLPAQTEIDPSAAQKQNEMAAAPDLADIIPLASNLSGSQVQLENQMKGLPGISAVEKKFSEYLERVEGFGAQLEEIQNAEGYNMVRLVNLSRMLKDEKTFFEFVNRPLVKEIRRVAAWKTEWVAEKKRWNIWENRLLSDQEPEQLKSAFAEAQATIDTAINIVQQQLETMLQVQAKGAAVKARIDELEAETQALIAASRAHSLLAASPPMFSPEYFSQFRRELWQKTVTNLRMITMPDSRFFVRQGWLLVAQLFLVFAVIFIIYRNRQPLLDSEHWRFLAVRPFATGIFVGILTLILFPKFQVFPTTLRLIYMVAGGISLILLLQLLLAQTWERQAAYGVVIIFVVTGAAAAVNLPLPLYRLYILVASILALYFCRRWTRESLADKEISLYVWLLRLGSVLAGVIVVAQLWGMNTVAAYLFKATVSSLAITLAFILFMYMIHGVLNWVFYSSPVWNIKQLRSEAETLVKRVGLIINASIVAFALLPYILSAWGLFGNIQEAAAGFLGLGFDIGSERISAGLMIAAVGILYASFLLSWILPKVLLDEKVAGAGLERGVRISVGRLIQYFIVFVGFILVIMVLGFDLTKLTIILSALGVGIGFGLQGIVNNFISGLILLFEQPVRIGDTIEMGGNWTEIKRIGLRSTTVRTLDEADVIIPNADLVSNQVTNWTLSNRLVRLTIPAGVAYGSDVPLVIETLMNCANDHEMVTKSPSPQVLFRSFGESSLDFELRVWITDVDYRLQVTSELHQEIDRRFREAGIEIAFPQRDLHLRTIDSSVIVQHSDAG